MGLNLDAVGKTIGPVRNEYTRKDLALYALGVGAGFEDLDYVYEERLKAIPTFATLSTYNFLTDFFTASGVDLAGIVHGEHELIVHSPIPAGGARLASEGRIRAMYDKGPGKGALVVAEVETCHEDGRKLFTNVATLFARLDGGFGGDPGPRDAFKMPEGEPDFEEVALPSPDQPLIYRLSGDTFALHVDAEFARSSGFEGPIMHGLCTLGFACRAVVKHLFPGEPERLVRLRNRFSRPLYPGRSIKTQIWRAEDGGDSISRAFWRTINVETGKAVMDRGIVEWVNA